MSDDEALPHDGPEATSPAPRIPLPTADQVFSLHPIGYVRSPHTERHATPRQPGAGPRPVEARIVLFPGQRYEQALDDLAGFEKIWVLFWFHRNAGWRPKVLPPRGPRVRRGVFATRSPHRPNALGLSLVTLRGVRGRTLDLGDVDILDGSPVFDLKPYLPDMEAFPNARAGWLDAVIRAEADGAARRYVVRWSPVAEAQRTLLAEHGVALAEHVETVLARDPTPHRHYRRVMPTPDGKGMVMAVRSWRVFFTVAGDAVEVTHLGSGYEAGAVLRAAPGSLLDDAAHRAFHARWPTTAG